MVKTFTLTFSTIQDEKRKPLIIDGQEVTLFVEAESKTSAMAHVDVFNLCNHHGNDCRVRGIT